MMRLITFLLLAASVKAGDLHFNKTVGVEKLLGELHSSTGLNFQGICASTCPIAGYLVASAGSLDVHVYDELGNPDVRVSTVAFSQALQDTITTTVNDHVP